MMRNNTGQLMKFIGTDVDTVVIVLNYNTAADTIACLESLLNHTDDSIKIILMDNGSADTDVAALSRFVIYQSNIQLICNDRNLGFAKAHNDIFDVLLKTTRIRYFILLNSDTIIGTDVVTSMRNTVVRTRADMVAARMWIYNTRKVESLGISYYKSGLGSNRKSEQEPLLGPTGGCALYTRTLLETLREVHGEIFDEDFFCYAEDTDLALRARRLGFATAFCGDTEVWHKVGRSSGGARNNFVLYHGIRNSLLALIKNWPIQLILRYAGWIVLMLIGVLVRHWRWNELRVVMRLYWDVLIMLPKMLPKRRRIQASRQISIREFKMLLSSRFYDHDVLCSSLKAILPQ